MKERITREELVKIYNIEITFFDDLEEAGLLKTETENNKKYLLYDDLSAFERYANWHYDLEINLPGLEVIHHLLERMDDLKKENRKLMNHLFKTTENWEETP